MHQIRGTVFIAVILGGVLALQILTMPRAMMGDAMAIRKVATHWAATGEFGIPFALKNEVKGWLGGSKHQWFYENDQRQRLYSRWGEMNTLLYVLPELVRQPTNLASSDEHLMFTNALNVAVAVGTAFYLLMLVRGLGVPLWANLLFLLSCFYGTYTSTYLRYHGYDLFQLFFFVAHAGHLFQFSREGQWRHFVWAQMALFCLVLCKPFYLLVYLPAAWVLRCQRKALMGLAICGVVAWLSNVGLTYFKSGVWMWSGDVPPPEGWGVQWSLEFLPLRLATYSVGKGSLLAHFPILLLALPFWPRFWRHHPLEAKFILMTFLLTFIPLLFFSTHGEFCFGPRFLLFILPLMALPIVTGLTTEVARVRAGVVVALVAVAGFFAFHQWQFHSRLPLTRHVLNSIVQPTSLLVEEYLNGTHDMKIVEDLNEFISHGRSFPVVEELLKRNAHVDVAAAKTTYQQWLNSKVPCNYYFDFLCP